MRMIRKIQNPLLNRNLSWSQLSHYLRLAYRLCHNEAASVGQLPSFATEEAVDGPRTVGRLPDEQYRLFLMQPNQPENPKTLKVSIIGEPNSGKSTLVNSLMGWRVNAVSSRVHTTRKNTSGLLTEGDTQIVFVDTPGVITAFQRKRHHCDPNMQTDPEESLHEVDAVGVVVDMSNKWTRKTLNKEVLKILHLHPEVTSFLILNKTDTLKNRNIMLEITRQLTLGTVGGNKMTFPDRVKGQKKDINKKEEMNTKYFDKLEQKYGAIKHKKKTSSSRFLEAYQQKLASLDAESNGIEDTEEFDSGKDGEIKVRKPGEQTFKYVDKNTEHYTTTNAKDKDVGKRIAKKASSKAVDDMWTVVEDNENVSEVVDKETIDHALSRSADNESLSADLDKAWSVDRDNESLEADAEIIDEEIISDDIYDETWTDTVHEESLTDNEGEEYHNQYTTDLNQSVGDNKQDMGDVSDSEDHTEQDMGNVNESVAELEKTYQSDFLAKLRANAAPSSADDKQDKQGDKEADFSWTERMERIKEAMNATGWAKFDRVFMVSALEGEGVDDIKKYLFDTAKPGNWEHNSCLVTPQHPHDIAKMCVWQCLLDNVPDWLPYSARPEIVYWGVDEHDRLDIVVEVVVDCQLPRFLGVEGATVKKIADQARQALLDSFQCEVSFKIMFRQKSRREPKSA